MRDTPPLDGVKKQMKGYKFPIPFLEDALVYKCSVFLFRPLDSWIFAEIKSAQKCLLFRGSFIVAMLAEGKDLDDSIIFSIFANGIPNIRRRLRLGYLTRLRGKDFGLFKHKEIILMNELRKNYKSFEEGLMDYIRSFMEAEIDFGCYAPPNEEEKKWLTEQFKSLWEAENCKMEDAVFRYY